MNILLLAIGKTDDKYILEGISIFEKRLKHYINYSMKIIPDIKNTKNMSMQEQKKKEGELLLKQIQPTDFIVLLDENGKDFNSVGFSKFIEKQMVAGAKQMVFVIGGAYGFSDEVYKRAHSKIALSKLTFSHQMVRLIFVEQIYRAMTILKGEPYHHI